MVYKRLGLIIDFETGSLEDSPKNTQSNYYAFYSKSTYSMAKYKVWEAMQNSTGIEFVFKLLLALKNEMTRLLQYLLWILREKGTTHTSLYPSYI